ncbi:MAG: glycosyltransferase, partial [Deltaproteobacteria bacterium]|nr:glycosyltransferase [Deltaproteobacteria bacterium]
KTIFVSDIINEKRAQTHDGRKIYTLDDIYPHADLVTYPSNFEGFGNAFLEAIYFKKPILVNTYSIYTMDIKPKGFKVIEIDGYVTQSAINKARTILNDPKLYKKMVNHNYKMAKNYYSYAILERKLFSLVSNRMGCQIYNQ